MSAGTKNSSSVVFKSFGMQEVQALVGVQIFGRSSEFW